MEDVRAAGSPAGGSAGSIAASAEHSWEAAAAIVFPVLRPAGSSGLRLDSLATPAAAAGHLDPLVDEGPAGLVVGYALAAGGFDVLAGGEHLAAWGISPATLREAALRNLDAWSQSAPWSEEVSGHRRIVSSDTGDGWDASRILLPAAMARLEALRGPGDGVLVGIPARHLLIAGSLSSSDPEFALQFADFVLEYAGDSDESIDRRVFELVDGRLMPFGVSAAG